MKRQHFVNMFMDGMWDTYKKEVIKWYYKNKKEIAQYITSKKMRLK